MIPDGANFGYPISVCVGHMLTTTAVVWLLRFAKPELFPGLISIPTHFIQTLALSVVAIGTLGAVTLTFSNFSVQHLSVALINMLKSANPVYALCMALVLGTMDSRGSMKQVAVACLLMLGGAVITCYGEVDVSAFGLVCFIGGVFGEQIRLVLLKKVISDSNFLWDPLSTLAVVAPVALVVLSIAAAAIEGPRLPYSRLASDSQLQHALLLNGLIAVALNVSYVRLLDVMSPVTFCVCGIGKDIVTAFASLSIVGGSITPLQVCGYVTSLTGFVYYDYVKTKQKEEAEAAECQLKADVTDVLAIKTYDVDETDPTPVEAIKTDEQKSGKDKDGSKKEKTRVYVPRQSLQVPAIEKRLLHPPNN
jgi:hypothetical protein